MPEPLRLLIEGLALRPPRASVAVIHRQAASVATAQGWPVPGYSTVHEIVRNLDPALVALGVEGSKRYREVYELVYRREASQPNQIWQADHTELDLWVLDPKGQPARPWLTAIEDDHSRAIAGYAVNLEPPSALSTALAFRQAIWRKAEPGWHVCGIPEIFHLDHGPAFTSAHLEQVMADLRVRPVSTLRGEPPRTSSSRPGSGSWSWSATFCAGRPNISRARRTGELLRVRCRPSGRLRREAAVPGLGDLPLGLLPVDQGRRRAGGPRRCRRRPVRGDQADPRRLRRHLRQSARHR
jgi:hypothetical protein